MIKGTENICDECDKDFKELYAYEGFIMTAFVAFLCNKCYKLKHGIAGKKDFQDTQERLGLKYE